MADIVQLAENGVLKYLKTHFKAVEGLDKELAKKQDKVDTGWIKATLTGGALQNATNPVEYRKVNGLVIVRGYIRLPNQVGAIIWTPPADFIPPSKMIVRTALEDTNLERKAFVRMDGGKMMVAYNNWSSEDYYIEAVYFAA